MTDMDRNSENKAKTKNVFITESERYRAMENLQDIQHLPSINALNLNYFGEEDCESGYTFGPFTRMNYVIHMVKSGKGRLIKKGKTFEITAGQAFAIYPGEENTYQADRQEPWSYMWVGFHGLMAEDIMSRTGFTLDSPVITCRRMPEISEIMEGLLSCSSMNFVDEMMRTGYLYQLLACMADNENGMPKEESRTDESRYVRTAINLLINSSDPQIKVSEVAKQIGVSRGYLTRIFRKETGTSPQEFQMKYRMEKAGALLRSTDSQVSVVAEELGYADVLSFSKSFHRFFGMSPTEFREQKVLVIAGEAKGSFPLEHLL